MRDYSKMTDAEFVEAYEKPYTEEERVEKDKLIAEQLKNREYKEMTDELIDALFDDNEGE